MDTHVNYSVTFLINSTASVQGKTQVMAAQGHSAEPCRQLGPPRDENAIGGWGVAMEVAQEKTCTQGEAGPDELSALTVIQVIMSHLRS